MAVDLSSGLQNRVSNVIQKHSETPWAKACRDSRGWSLTGLPGPTSCPGRPQPLTCPSINSHANHHSVTVTITHTHLHIHRTCL